MLEILLILSIFYACLFMPLRGKDFSQLTPAQQERVGRYYARFMRTRKGKRTPDMTVEKYLSVLQRQAITYLVMAIVILPVYIAFVAALYRPMFTGGI